MATLTEPGTIRTPLSRPNAAGATLSFRSEKLTLSPADRRTGIVEYIEELIVVQPKMRWGF